MIITLIVSLSSALTNKLLVRVTNYFDSQIRIPALESGPNGTTSSTTHAAFQESVGMRRKMTNQQVISWYAKILESARLRHRRLHRFARHVIFV
jgi:mitogen-activated protein kinase kinase kinase